MNKWHLLAAAFLLCSTQPSTATHHLKANGMTACPSLSGNGSALESVATETYQPDSLDLPMYELARQFVSQPTRAYRPYVWWHWMGSNFSKEGITKDLESMAEASIGGATIFNLSSAVQESHTPIGNTPWPEQTYRSPAYWDAIRHAASETKRLGYCKTGIRTHHGQSAPPAR